MRACLVLIPNKVDTIENKDRINTKEGEQNATNATNPGSNSLHLASFESGTYRFWFGEVPLYLKRISTYLWHPDKLGLCRGTFYL